MNPANDGEKRNGGALEGGVEEEGEMIDLFELASENETVYPPEVEDIFYFCDDEEGDEDYEDDDSDEEDDGDYDDSDEEDDEDYDDSDEEDDEDYDDSDEEDDGDYDDSDDSDEEDDEDYDDSDEEEDGEDYDDSDEEDDEDYDDSDDEEDEDYDDSDEEDDEDYDDSDEEDDEDYDDSDDEEDDGDYDDSDEEDDGDYDDSDEEDDEDYDDSDDEDDEDYDDSDDEEDGEEYDDSDEEDGEDYDDSDEEGDEDYDDSDEEDDEDYDDSDEEDDEDYDDSDEEDGDYDYDDSDDEEDEVYDDSDEEDDEDYDDSDDEEDEDYDDSDEDYDEEFDDSDEEDEEDFVPASVLINQKLFDDDGGDPLPLDESDLSGFTKTEEEEATVDLFEMAGRYDDLPETETHGGFYYWAKRKTVSGWVKFALKCFAVLLLIIVASGVLYFNGLLDLIDYKAADDFEQYYNLSETDYQDDIDDVYSTPVFYNESTTIEGFNDSMIDIPQKDVLNILLIGTDVRGGTYEDRGNTDSMILVSVNTRDKNIKLTSFMRDMYVTIPERGKARLNAAYAYGGPQLLFDTLKQNFDVDVDLYVRVNFANFRKIVNHVGGVDIELSPAEARYMNKYSQKYNTDPVEPGWQHLDGAQALSYARCRKIDSDFNRTKRQRTVILALVKEIKGSSPSELNSLLNVFLPMIQTNMSKMQILGLMADGTRYLNTDIETLNIPIKYSWRSELINKRDVIVPNFELNKKAIVAHIYSTYRLDEESNMKQAATTTSVAESSETTATTLAASSEKSDKKKK